METLLFVIEVQCDYIKVEIHLNDIKVLVKECTENNISQVKLNPWIVEGTNHLRILLGYTSQHWVARGNEEVATPIIPLFKFKLVKGEHGKEPSEEGVIVDYQWQADISPLQFDGMTTVWEQYIQIQEGFGHWLWESAPKGKLSTKDEKEIFALIRKTHTALVNREVEHLMQLMEIKLIEMSKALGIPKQTIENSQRTFFISLFQSPDWSMAPLDFNTLALMPQAEGRLIAIENRANNLPLRGFANNNTVSFKLMVSRINGKWQIIR